MVAFVFLRKPPPNLPEGRRSYPDGIFHASRYLQSTIYKVQACPLFFVLIYIVLCTYLRCPLFLVLCTYLYACRNGKGDEAECHDEKEEVLIADAFGNES